MVQTYISPQMSEISSEVVMSSARWRGRCLQQVAMDAALLSPPDVTTTQVFPRPYAPWMKGPRERAWQPVNVHESSHETSTWKTERGPIREQLYYEMKLSCFDIGQKIGLARRVSWGSTFVDVSWDCEKIAYKIQILALSLILFIEQCCKGSKRDCILS